jgi:hypothetical protein
LSIYITLVDGRIFDEESIVITISQLENGSLKQISPLLVLWQNLGAGSGHASIYH